MYEIKIAKEKIRAVYLEKRKNLAPDVKAEYDAAICRRFMSLVTYRFASTILIYAPKPDEIDVNPIARAALAAGKRVAFPRCDPRTCSMDFHLVTGLDQLEKGYFGIMEPPSDLPLYDRRSARGDDTVCIIPALVCDLSGYRLGYGKGYYDRYLADFGGVKVGFVYNCCLTDRVPRGHFDLACDFLVTETSCHESAHRTL